MSTMAGSVSEKLAEVGRKLIDKTQAAAKLGNISIKTLDRMPVPGKVTLRGRVLFDPVQLDAWIAAGCPGNAGK